MQYRTMNSTGDKLSVLGFGGMRFPEKNGKIDEERATRQIRFAIDHGVNYFDTAAIYHYGASEPFLGRALSGSYREKVNLATKLPWWYVRTREDMDKILNSQLDKLKTDHIDYYLIHYITINACRCLSCLPGKWMVLVFEPRRHGATEIHRDFFMIGGHGGHRARLLGKEATEDAEAQGNKMRPVLPAIFIPPLKPVMQPHMPGNLGVMMKSQRLPVYFPAGSAFSVPSVVNKPGSVTSVPSIIKKPLCISVAPCLRGSKTSTVSFHTNPKQPLIIIQHRNKGIIGPRSAFGKLAVGRMSRSP